MATPQLTLTPSTEIIAGLQTRFGSIDYSRWQSVRAEFYSYITYPLAGAASFTFFGNAIGGNVGATTLTTEDTNMPRAGSFGQQHFLIKSIHTSIRIADEKLSAYVGTDATTLASDYLMGFVNAGVLNFTIGARPFLQLPVPFKFAPPLSSSARSRAANPTSTTGGPPSTGFIGDYPAVTQTSNRSNIYRLDPNILIEAEQQFGVSIDFPTGLVPLNATSVVNNDTNPLKVGVTLSGVLLRPMT